MNTLRTTIQHMLQVAGQGRFYNHNTAIFQAGSYCMRNLRFNQNQTKQLRIGKRRTCRNLRSE